MSVHIGHLGSKVEVTDGAKQSESALVVLGFRSRVCTDFTAHIEDTTRAINIAPIKPSRTDMPGKEEEDAERKWENEHLENRLGI